MTGTAQTSAEEFHKVYGLEVITIPTNRPNVRKDVSDSIYKDLDAKYKAIAREVKKKNEAGQPVLIGTVSIEKNEVLSSYLKAEGVPHEMLNAKNHEREGQIIAQAGREGAVTVATNMAGRGVDIILGGNPPVAEQAEKVKNAGGLHVIGTERHEARRIDNQLRGRSGRQGDPGSSQFFLSLEDDLLRIFGGDRIKNMMERFDLPADVPIENKLVSRSVSQAQGKIEGFNFDMRKHLLDYDDILNKQRLNFYGKRQRVLNAIDKDGLVSFLEEVMLGYLDKIEKSELSHEEMQKALKEGGLEAKSIEEATEEISKRLRIHENLNAARIHALSVLDFFWMNHLEDIEALVESVRLRAYGQKDPLVEYRRESKILFDTMTATFESWAFINVFKLEKLPQVETSTQAAQPKKVEFKDVGRNDPCPCGAKDQSGHPIKYKRCHGR